MTLTDTLDHLLSVFLRPLRTWIERELVAPLRAAYDAAMQTKEQYRDGVYLHLRERLEGTDEHPLAEGVPVRPLPATQDLEHLQAAVELLDSRKVDVGESVGIDDGIHLARFICADQDVTSKVTELIDNNEGWIMKTTFPSSYPNLIKLTLNCIEKRERVSFLVNHSSLEIVRFPFLEVINDTGQTNVLSNLAKCRELHFDKLQSIVGAYITTFGGSCPLLEFVYMPFFEGFNNTQISFFYSLPMLKKVVFGKLSGLSHNSWQYANSPTSITFYGCGRLIHFEIGDKSGEHNINLNAWSPTMALRTDTTASDYIDLREDKDDSGEFINATNLEQFLANFRKYIILRVANRTGQTALTLTLSAAVYQNIYGLDSSNTADNNSWARTHTLADLGLTADDLTEAETAAGITINTIYATWLDTYRSAINWNIGH